MTYRLTGNSYRPRRCERYGLLVGGHRPSTAGICSRSSTRTVTGPRRAAGPRPARAGRRRGAAPWWVLAPVTTWLPHWVWASSRGCGDVVRHVGHRVLDHYRTHCRRDGSRRRLCRMPPAGTCRWCARSTLKVTDAVARLLGVDHAGLDPLALDGARCRWCDVLPYFDGERTPNRPKATGWLSGLRSDIGREQLARAAVEGVVCGLLDALDALRTNSALDGRLMLTGGGAHRTRCRR